MRESKVVLALLMLPAPLTALIVWLSPLAFVPVPWPDDSAFYFVASEFFKWPPRWVMLSQAPFEPSYALFNFNTMPLYPVLIGLGRIIGIDGSFALKLWPLSAWALSGALLAYVLFKRTRLPLFLVALVILAVALDPILRWASVLVRPESLVGFLGLALVLGLTFGFPQRLKRESWYWDPVAFLLASAAYAHFNAIHLLFPVIAVFLFRPGKLFSIGAKTALYLLPWLVAVVWHWPLFIQQMQTQWARLAVPNRWLSSVPEALSALIPELGNPAPWPTALLVAAGLLWLILIAALCVLAVTLVKRAARAGRKSSSQPAPGPDLLPASAWVLGTLWLWHTKPEVWFLYYTHLAAWCFAGLALARLWEKRRETSFNRLGLVSLGALMGIASMIFIWVNGEQFYQLRQGVSWRWSTYRNFVDCVDQRLSAHLHKHGSKGDDGVFRVWAPTFPDILIELSRRHPDWALTRTNDFFSRRHLAVRHGYEVDAVVITETLRWEERTLSSPAENHPELASVWMTWSEYFLNTLWLDPKWKPKRHICQQGRWQAYIFMER